MRQQTLNAWPDPATRFEAFEPGPNSAVVAAVAAGDSLWVHGPVGSGKSHLAHAGVAERGGFYLSLADDQLTPDVLDGLDQFTAVVLDDIDSVVGDANWEHALFALWNGCLDQGNRLWVFSAEPVDGLDWAIADLRSRAGQLPQYALRPLSDDDLIGLLRRRAAVLDLRLAEDVIAYVMRRHGRSTKQLVGLLNQIERASLRDQRVVTVPFVRTLLGDRSGAQD